jgi:hypothetical protein
MSDEKSSSKLTLEAVILSAVTLLLSGGSVAFGYGMLTQRMAGTEVAIEQLNKRMDITDARNDLHLRDEQHELEKVRTSLETINTKLAAICASVKCGH